MTNFIGDIIMSREMIIGASNTLVVNHHWCVDEALNSIHVSKDTGSKHCCVVGRLFETVACGICFEVCGRNVAAISTGQRKFGRRGVIYQVQNSERILLSSRKQIT